MAYVNARRPDHEVRAPAIVARLAYEVDNVGHGAGDRIDDDDLVVSIDILVSRRVRYLRAICIGDSVIMHEPLVAVRDALALGELALGLARGNAGGRLLG